MAVGAVLQRRRTHRLRGRRQIGRKRRGDQRAAGPPLPVAVILNNKRGISLAGGVPINRDLIRERIPSFNSVIIVIGALGRPYFGRILKNVNYYNCCKLS